MRESLPEALRELDARLPLAVPVLIGGDRGRGEPGSTPPTRARPRAWWPGPGVAGEADAAAAVDAAERGFRDWGAAPGGRARRRAARRPPPRLRERRLELAALLVRECAKPWAEADADVCEAIDFLEYYARAADRAGARARAAAGAGRAQHHALRARAGWPR